MRETKQKRIEVRVSETLLAQLQRLATVRGVRISEAIRTAIINECKGIKK